MDAKLKKKWLRALRSENYEQGNSALVTKDGSAFCCLGVLADIQGCVWVEKAGIAGLVPIMPNGRKTFGINSAGVESSCYLKPRMAGRLSIGEQKGLAAMNDSGKSLPEIADYIEENL